MRLVFVHAIAFVLLLALCGCGVRCWPWCNLMTGCPDYPLPPHTPIPPGIG
jgi:hypothetical protein